MQQSSGFPWNARSVVSYMWTPAHLSLRALADFAAMVLASTGEDEQTAYGGPASRAVCRPMIAPSPPRRTVTAPLELVARTGHPHRAKASTTLAEG